MNQLNTDIPRNFSMFLSRNLQPIKRIDIKRWRFFVRKAGRNSRNDKEKK